MNINRKISRASVCVYSLLMPLSFFCSLLVGCSSDEESIEIKQSVLPEDSVIRISAQVNGLLETRAESDVSAYTGTSLGLFIRPQNEIWGKNSWDNNTGDATAKYNYPNVKFTKDAEGNWTQNAYTPMIWKGESTAYEYYAFAPANSMAEWDAGDNLYLKFDLGGQHLLTKSDNELKNDLLWTSKSGTASSLLSNKQLTLQFDHMLCKVKVVLELGDEFFQKEGENTENFIDSVCIDDVVCKGQMNLKTGEIENSLSNFALQFPKNGATFTPGTDSSTGEYVTPYIFCGPGNFNFHVYIYTPGRTFRYIYDKVLSKKYEFRAGNQYVIKLRVGKDVVKGKNITVEAWKTGTGGNLTTE